MSTDWEGMGPCTSPIHLKMAHQSKCRILRNGLLKIIVKIWKWPRQKSLSNHCINYIAIEHSCPVWYTARNPCHWQLGVYPNTGLMTFQGILNLYYRIRYTCTWWAYTTFNFSTLQNAYHSTMACFRVVRKALWKQIKYYTTGSAFVNTFKLRKYHTIFTE